GGEAAQADDEGAVLADVVDLRQEAVGIDRGVVAHVAAPAEVAVGQHVALAVAAEGIEGDAFGRAVLGVVGKRAGIDFRVAVTLCYHTVAGFGAVGVVLVPALRGQVQEAGFAHGDAGVAAEVPLFAVPGAHLADAA